ncbi:MAG: hypothetical protein ACK55Q_22145, partial [Dolichospermum sp.]
FFRFCVSHDDSEKVWEVIKSTQNISPNPEYVFFWSYVISNITINYSQNQAILVQWSSSSTRC